MKDNQGFPWVYLAAVVFAIVSAQLFVGTSQRETVRYSDFVKLLQARQIDNLEISDTDISGEIVGDKLQGLLQDQQIAAIRAGKPPYRFSTTRVSDPKLPDELAAAGVHYTGIANSTWFGSLLAWVAPALLMIVLWSVMMPRVGGSRGVLGASQSNAKVYMQSETGVTFDDVAGIDEAKAELTQIVAFLRYPDRYRRLGGKIPKGVLIAGPPGTGKTLLAKAVAGQAQVPFFSISGSAFVEMFVGVGAARVRDLFSQAQRCAPCIVFIDELDALGKVRGMSSMGGNDEREQTLNQLLVEMDGFDTNSGVIIMAATNRPEILDPALLRAGRFDRHVVIDRPDLIGRQQILRVHTKSLKMAADVDVAELAARTPGFVGSDLANIANEAALHAAQLDKNAVDLSDFIEAIDRQVAGTERKSRVMSLREKETIAVHESGHAVIAASRPGCDPVTKVSIMPRGVAALGYTQQLPTEDRYVLRRSELLDRLDAMLGGRVAEELMLGDISTGAENDLQRATELVEHMVTRYGMSERVGLAYYGDTPTQAFGPLPGMAQTPLHGERTTDTIDAEVCRLIEESHARVRSTLNVRRGQLERVKSALLEHEVLNRAAFLAALDGPVECAAFSPRSSAGTTDANAPASSEEISG